ncbi:MAG TPA: cation:proton antiporter [Kofleriaceae bacterium]|nr:cation:proton antiporter [Kofleriaceae bacterium]
MHDASIYAGIALVLVLAKVAGDLFERAGQPAVLGELLAGVALGNVDLLGWRWFEGVAAQPAFQGLAQVGVILLLFVVGLESDLGKMARSGAAAAAVAVVGVIVPMGLGFGVHALLTTGASWHVHLFVGAVLAATSVGITARVLRDLGRLDTPTARVILGAAVIDDVLGLVVLAIVGGVVQGADTGEGLDALDVLRIVGLAVGFLAGAMLLGRTAATSLFRVVSALQTRGVLLAIALAFCFALAFAAAEVGLHPIVGAFAAGLVLDDVSLRPLEGRDDTGLETQLAPIAGFLVPIFFVATGAAVDLGALTGDSLVLAGLLTVVAILGKQACSLVAFGDGVDRVSVGVGMIPRGEVGLIFAAVGTTLTIAGVPVVGPSTYAAIILMVMVTTLVTPPALKWSLGRRGA